MAGFWNRLLGIDTYDAAQRVLPEPYEPWMGTYGVPGIPVADPGYPLALHGRMHVEAVWRTQPNVRKVVDFIARNVASIPLHVYDRVSDTERRRVTGHPLSEAVSSPRAGVGAYRFWHGVISDGLLYDRWAIIKMPHPDGGGVQLVQVPSWRLRFAVDGLRRVIAAHYWVGDIASLADDGQDGWAPLDLDALIFDHGYSPASAGMSPLETLKDILDENTEAVRYRRQVWENGARVPAWIERPAGHAWDPVQRDRFVNHFRNTYTGSGEGAGGVPVLEDGMKLNALNAFNPQEAMDLEGRRLTSAEVASAFHVAPELVGARQGTYSNIDAFRQMLYRDSLGPYITAWEQAVNASLTPDLAGGRALYVEAHVEAKLRGSFIEQAQIGQSTVGAPTMTRNEFRARMNMPPIEGGDALVTPLNVLVGGQASPQDAGSQNRTGQASRSVSGAKARAPQTWEKRTADVLSKFFKRQRVVVLSALGAKAAGDWWDAERWDSELSDDLFKLAVATAKQVSAQALDRLGFDPDVYDEDRTLAFLRAVSDSRAGMVNSTTREQIEAALASDPDDYPDGDAPTPAHVFDVAESGRVPSAAAALVTTFSAFATTEAAKQVAGTRATKTWVTTSGNPRSSHAAMNGETVGVEEPFSNGMNWPGDPSGGADEVAGCLCDVTINIP